MARKRNAAPKPPSPGPSGAPKAEYDTKDYPPEKVASVVTGEPQALPPAPGFGHFTDPGLGAVMAPAEMAPKVMPGPPDFGHFTDPGVPVLKTEAPRADPAANLVVPAKAPAFQLTPYSMEPDTAPTPNLQTLAPHMVPAPETRPDPPLPSYLVTSDGSPIHEPAVRRRIQVAWLAGAALLIGASLIVWLRPGPPPTPGSVAAYELAAKQGDVKAMRTLGTWYTYGLNVKQDPGRGRYWYKKAAETGDPVAQQELKAIEGK